MLTVGEQRTVRVASRPRWVATGAVLVAGGSYDLTATGTWTDWRTECGPDGYASPNRVLRWAERLRRHREADWFTLIGTVGSNGAATFAIGSGTTHLAEAGGELRCFANDVAWFGFNNSGAVELTIRRTA
ncbi:UNVERIFIED_CONTAM: hypothetical protein LK11_03950 [Mumia flava]